jgi:hypothetical protein
MKYPEYINVIFTKINNNRKGVAMLKAYTKVEPIII